MKVKHFVSEFKPELCKRIRFDKNSINSIRNALKTATRNLWAHFGIDTQADSKKKYSVMDFSMTEQFEQDFYNHHKNLLNFLKQHYPTDYAFWFLDYTPSMKESAKGVKRKKRG